MIRTYISWNDKEPRAQIFDDQSEYVGFLRGLTEAETRGGIKLQYAIYDSVQEYDARKDLPKKKKSPLFHPEYAVDFEQPRTIDNLTVTLENATRRLFTAYYECPECDATWQTDVNDNLMENHREHCHNCEEADVAPFDILPAN